MSFTHGSPGKRKRFTWRFDIHAGELFIVNEDGRQWLYSLEEIKEIVLRLEGRFSSRFFPLSGNITVHGRLIEQDGFGTAILDVLPGDFARLTGASYLGVVLEESGVLQWNGKSRGIGWSLVESELSATELRHRLSRPASQRA